MYPVSEGFTAALAQSHRIAARAELVTATDTYVLDVTDGSVTVDGSAAVRRRCTVTLTDDSGKLVPADITDLLAPNGNELKLYRGVTFADGSTELVPLGVFRITKPQVSGGRGTLVIRVDGYDRARAVQRARFTETYTIPAGTNYATAISDLLESRVTGLSFNLAATDHETSGPLVYGTSADNDPWKDATELAKSIGFELFFDADGVCVLRPEPDPSAAATVASYAEGDNATILSVDRELSDEETYNHVVVSGESQTTTPVRAEARDEDPSSATYYLGPFGDVPRFYASPLITTSAQAQDAADALLRRSLGLVEVVRFSAVPNPAHDVGDVVQVAYSAGRVDGLYVLDQFTVPLSAGGVLTATTRKRRAA